MEESVIFYGSAKGNIPTGLGVGCLPPSGVIGSSSFAARGVDSSCSRRSWSPCLCVFIAIDNVKSSRPVVEAWPAVTCWVLFFSFLVFANHYLQDISPKHPKLWLLLNDVACLSESAGIGEEVGWDLNSIHCSVLCALLCPILAYFSDLLPGYAGGLVQAF